MKETKRNLKTWGWLATALAAGAFVVVAFWRPGFLRGTPNDGHQLGGDLMSDLSGNTIECFERGIRDFEDKDSWHYSECDVRETKDHQLILFHDWDLSSLKNSPENRKAIGSDVGHQAICDLTLGQISALQLNCGSRIPTLEKFLEKASELNLQKPLLIEFKHLHSDSARNRLLDLAKQYRDEHGIEIHFLSFIRNVEICFPESQEWMKKFKDNDFRVYQVYRPKTEEYDMCRWWK